MFAGRLLADDAVRPIVAAVLRHGVFVPPFNELAEPHRLVELAEESEEAGFDGFFLWDHVLRSPEEAREVADPFVVLAAVAVATKNLRIGTMVTPLVRRRPQVLARQVVTLDHLSGGRAVLGLGLGVDSTGELSRFGEVVALAERAALLDEGAQLMAEYLSGEVVNHKGRYFLADGVQLLPRPLQSPRVPIWLGARGGNDRPVTRAAGYDGVFLIDSSPAEIRDAVEVVTEKRGSLDGFELAVLSDCGLSLAEAESAGVSWVMSSIQKEWSFAEALSVARGGPRFP